MSVFCISFDLMGVYLFEEMPYKNKLYNCQVFAALKAANGRC